MSDTPLYPRPQDAVQGGNSQYPVEAVVLGGLEGIKQRLAHHRPQEVQIAALSDALKYGEAGLQLVIEGLQSEAERVRNAAYLLLRQRTEPAVQQALINYWRIGKKSFDAKELASQGCCECMAWTSPTTHDWYLSCNNCGRVFSYGGCSCDGCCGEGTYQGFGGGTEYFSIGKKLA